MDKIIWLLVENGDLTWLAEVALQKNSQTVKNSQEAIRKAA